MPAERSTQGGAASTTLPAPSHPASHKDQNEEALWRLEGAADAQPELCTVHCGDAQTRPRPLWLHLAQTKQEALQRRKEEAEALRAIRAEQALARAEAIKAQAAEAAARDAMRRQSLNSRIEARR